jgi:hypothetical protein
MLCQVFALVVRQHSLNGQAPRERSGCPEISSCSSVDTRGQSVKPVLHTNLFDAPRFTQAAADGALGSPRTDPNRGPEVVVDSFRDELPPLSQMSANDYLLVAPALGAIDVLQEYVDGNDLVVEPLESVLNRVFDKFVDSRMKLHIVAAG